MSNSSRGTGDSQEEEGPSSGDDEIDDLADGEIFSSHGEDEEEADWDQDDDWKGRDKPLEEEDGDGGLEDVEDGDLNDINVASFDELKLTQASASHVQDTWRAFVSSCGTWEAAGVQIWHAIIEGSPAMKTLFTSPKAVAALNFYEGINSLVIALDDPAGLKIKVETLSFGHLNVEASTSRVSVVRDSMLDLFQTELGSNFDTAAYTAWRRLLNYVGGAMIFIKSHYGARLKILDESWLLANTGNAQQHSNLSRSSERGGSAAKAAEKPPDPKVAERVRWSKQKSSWRKKAKYAKDTKESREVEKCGDAQAASVPTTFPEMFLFNSAVMGFGASSAWMKEVLGCFDNIVRNVSNPSRFQEECDVLVLRLARVTSQVKAPAPDINLADFKSCMLASLRSLLPKTWSTEHELAWSWLWENAERILKTTMGKPPKWEAVWGRFLANQTEEQAYDFRSEVYTRFFTVCPEGQDLFKMSNTYLHLTATKIMTMTLEIYRQPVQMADTISALGLRHVGYGIPTRFFGPWASTWIGVLSDITEDQTVVEAMRWSMGLITKSLVRTILEGSTIVMKAINVNSQSAMKKAIACAPRGERCKWMLKVQVGTQSISPLAWAIDSGALAAASTMLKDILTIRADRDNYYFGVDEMFTRHPDLIKKLIDNAPALLPELLSGLIWRSRLTSNGTRRVNYYIRHLLLDEDGKFANTLKWMAKFKDPHIVCHPTMVLLADIVWKRVALPLFLYRKSWFFGTVIVFIIDKGVLDHLEPEGKDAQDNVRLAVFLLRCHIYVCSLGSLVYSQVRNLVKCIRSNDFVSLCKGFSIPQYLWNWQELVKLLLALALIVMLSTDPILFCLAEKATPTFTNTCPEGDRVKRFPHSFFSMVAMFLYFLPLVDLAVLSNSVAAYVLVCGFMLSELCLFLFLGLVILLMFSSGLGCLEIQSRPQSSIPQLMEDLYDMFLGWYTGEAADLSHANLVVLLSQWCFLVCLLVFLGNMLVAQLSCAYGTIYADVVGYARLKRINIIVESMPQVSDKAWNWFINSLRLDRKIVFNEGDVGVAGGIATTEPASLHPTNVDSIRRYGGSTSPLMQWPDESDVEEEGDVFERIERVITKHTRRVERKKANRLRQALSNGTGGTTATSVFKSAGTGTGGGSGEADDGASDCGE